MAKTRFLYFGNQYIGEADETNTVTKRYVNEPDTYTNLIGQHDVASGNNSYHHYDAIGSTRSVTGDTETVTDTFTYDAWGDVLSRTGASGIRFQYVGRYGYCRDEATESYYVMERSYTPESLRWLTVDPSGVFVSLNPFMYAANNPENLLDPSGLAPCGSSYLTRRGCLEYYPKCKECFTAVCDLSSNTVIGDLLNCAHKSKCLDNVTCFKNCGAGTLGRYCPDDKSIELCFEADFRNGQDWINVLLEEVYHALTICKGGTKSAKTLETLGSIIKKNFPNRRKNLTRRCLRYAAEEIAAKYCAGVCSNPGSCLLAAVQSKLVKDNCQSIVDKIPTFAPPYTDPIMKAVDDMVKSLDSGLCDDINKACGIEGPFRGISLY
jgi:RHS repeat-associated protein